MSGAALVALPLISKAAEQVPGFPIIVTKKKEVQLLVPPMGLVATTACLGDQ